MHVPPADARADARVVMRMKKRRASLVSPAWVSNWAHPHPHPHPHLHLHLHPRARAHAGV
jgi:diadenosine tetraphosphate (Ap4A) HIT family hydrolase